MHHIGSRALRLAVSAALSGMLALPCTALALDSFFVGPRAMGMAGANVASVTDTTAQYYNPAAFGFFARTDKVANAKGVEEERRSSADNNYMGRKIWGWDVASAGAGLSLHENLAELTDEISKIDIDSLEQGVNDSDELAELVRLANNLSLLEQPGSGLRASVAGGTGLRIQNFGLGVRAYGQGAGRVLDIDTVNFGLQTSGTLASEISGMDMGPGYQSAGYTFSVFTPDQKDQLVLAYGGDVEAVQKLDYIARQEGVAPGDQATVDLLAASGSGTGELSDNTTAIQLTAFGLTEIPLSYGYAFNDHFSVGGNIKAMIGRVYATNILVFDSESSDIVSNMTEEYKQTTTWGLDLGAMARFKWVQLGVVGRNLNSPKFKGPTISTNAGPVHIDDVTIKPQAQAGIAFIPFETFTIEVDYDLTKNETQLEGYDTQYLRAGVEWDIFRILALRGGVYNNMAEDDIGLVYTAGVGLNLWGVRLDVSGAMSDKTAMYDGKEYPREVQLVAGLSIDF